MILTCQLSWTSTTLLLNPTQNKNNFIHKSSGRSGYFTLCNIEDSSLYFIYAFVFLICLQQAFFENKPLEKTKKDPKRLSVERIYQKKTQLEHILLRPDSYIGSVEPVTQVRSLHSIY